MKRILIVVPHSHTWMWTQTCIACLKRFPPVADGCETKIVVVDNSWSWSPSIRGIKETSLGDGIEVFNNPKTNRFHASALDAAIERYDFDLLMALETDVAALHHKWLQWFVDQIERDPNTFAVGHWHHESFINPSCTLYRAKPLREMLAWCKANTEPDVLRWGEGFQNVQPIAARQPERDYLQWFGDTIEWLVGPFAEKRGWPAGTVLRHPPSGQLKGPGWYEPGQAFYHWAMESGLNPVIAPTTTVLRRAGLPVATYYGDPFKDGAPGHHIELNQMWGIAYIVHLWGGTRALDIIKHRVDADDFVSQNMSFWLQREARYWQQAVPEDVRAQTVALIKKHRWHIKGEGTPETTDRDRDAAAFVEHFYRQAGIPL